jgi:mannose-6-phosphate isomerase
LHTRSDVADAPTVPDRYRVAVRAVHGIVQHYAWGDPAFLPNLLGREPDGRPWAEWWLGTHPAGPSRLDEDTLLAEVTGELPYLLKVLCAAAPLSLQTHPSAEQAVDGHRRGVFGDPHAKPELLMALTPFVALCGVRPPEPTVDLLGELGLYELAEAVTWHGVGGAIERIYRGLVDLDRVVEACERSARPEAAEVVALSRRYPGEASVAVTLLLHRVELRPGEAIRLPAGNLHAYLRGCGIELMGASDNVVRGGLTVKPVDVELLLATVDPTPIEDPVLPDTGHYELPELGRELRRLEPGTSHRALDHELAVDLAGGAWLLAPGEVVTVEATTFVVTRAAG